MSILRTLRPWALACLLGACRRPTVVAPAPSPPIVRVHLTPLFPKAERVSFGVPLARGSSADRIGVRLGGALVPDARVRELLPDLDEAGKRVGSRAVLVQLDASHVPPEGVDVELVEGATAPTGSVTSFADVSIDSRSVVKVATRTIAAESGGYVMKITSTDDMVAFVGREPRVLAELPEGWLAKSGVLGDVLGRDETDRVGVRWLSDAASGFLRSAMFDEPYPLAPEAIPDMTKAYEAWLYDRCATFLLGHAHLGGREMLRHALRTCSFYAAHIDERGFFDGKPGQDLKYSHARGLHTYFALTGDERAARALRAMADLWLADESFVGPYRAGRLRASDRLWTERHLGTSMEALYYGHRLTGEAKYFTALSEMIATAHCHVTTGRLPNVDPGFPPQSCFLHSALQHDEGGPDSPWCSTWMSALTLDVLLQWHRQTGDPRVPEIFAHLGRFVRDVGTSTWNDCRIPAYGAGIGKDGKAVLHRGDDDEQHCADGAALVAAARWALERTGGSPGDRASMAALFRDFAVCARRVWDDETRPKRDPSRWTSAMLAEGAADPAKFLAAQKIGYPSHVVMPLRKSGWWWNVALLIPGLLADAKLTEPPLPATCN